MAEPIVLFPYDPAWPGRYEAERSRIVASLGELLEGGVLDGIEHIGSTSIPGMRAKPCLDLMARVHPFLLEEERIRALRALGYDYRGENGLPGRDYFTRGPHEVHLHVFGFETEHWTRHLLFRDYLRAEAGAARRYEALKLELAERFRDDRAAYTDGKAELVRGLEGEAYGWHVRATGFAPVERAAEELAGVGVPWMVSSGWALELFLGAPSRPHDDLDLAVFRDDQLAVQRHLSERGWRLDRVVEGRYAPWRAGEALGLEVTQVHARRDGVFMDLLLSPRRGDDWLYRRDEGISLPLSRARMSARGLPYLAPEAALLFKSRSSQQGRALPTPRAKDERDFARVLPQLEPERRRWLASALRRTNPAHPWLEPLGGGSQPG